MSRYYTNYIRPHLKPILRRLRQSILKFTLKYHLTPIHHLLFRLWIGHIDNQKNFLKDQDHQIYFVYRSRIFFHYALGIKYRLRELYESYLLNKITFEKDDIFIDCGSNIGEVSLALFKLNPIKNLKGCLFELEVPEIEASQKTLDSFNVQLINKALSHRNGEINFYSNPESADSSIIQTKGSTLKTIETLTLDSFFEEQNIKTCKLLKLEAEGAEIEVLQGATDALTKIQYVSVDCGPERGENNESTLSTVNDFLVNHGFYLIETSKKRDVCLYRNKSEFEVRN